jgi:hypothetical protein
MGFSSGQRYSLGGGHSLAASCPSLVRRNHTYRPDLDSPLLRKPATSIPSPDNCAAVARIEVFDLKVVSIEIR